MPSRDVEIVLKAKDQSSQTLRQVGRAADDMGRDMERAGKTSARSMEQARGAGRELAVGVGLVAGAFAKASRDAIKSADAIRTLRRGYEDSADSLIDFANALQDATTFSNESAIAAINTFRTLRDNYGFTEDQIRTLVEVSADLATTTGIDLADAAFRVQSAMRGEAEASEVLGLTLNDQALGIDHLAKSTTDAEKAQIRFTALQEQANFAQGAAAEKAATTAGQVTQLANRVQDATERFVNFTGPVGQVAGSLGAFGLEVGLAAGGVAALAKGLRGLQAAGVLGGLVPLLGGPVGIGIAGAAIAAGVALVKLADSGEKWEEAARGSAAATSDLNDLLAILAEQGTKRALVAADFIETVEVLTDGIDQLTERQRTLKEEQERLLEQEVELRAANVGTGQARLDEIDATIKQREAIEAEIAVIEQETEALGGLENANKEVADTKAALLEILSHTGPGFDEAAAAVERLTERYVAGEITLLEYMNGIQLVTTILDDYDLKAIAAAESTKQVGDAAVGTAADVDTLKDSADGFVTGVLRMNERLQESVGAVREQREGLALLVEVHARGEQAAADQEAALLDLAAAHNETEHAIHEHNQALLDLIGDAERIDDILLSLGKTMSGEQGLIRISQDVERAGSNLQSVLAVVVRGTDELGRPLQAANDFIVELVASTSFLDTALKSGRITQEEYNAALAAEETIVENNTAAQAHLDAIRAKQAPLVAEQADAYEDYLETLAALPAAEQQQALAFASSGEQAKIANSFATAYAASLGEIPKDVATEMIVSDAQADPVLKDILLDYGLIEEGADGKITVNFPEGETLQQTLDKLNETLQDLNETIARPTVELNTSDPDAKLPELEAELGTVDATIVTPTVNIHDNASGILSNLIGNLQFLDGFTATSVVETVQRTRFETIGAGLVPFGTGGTVHGDMALPRGAATGITVGEFGPEVIPNPPAGLQVMPHGGSMSRVAAAGRRGERPIQVNIHGNIYGVDDLQFEIGRALRAHGVATGRIN